MCKLENSFPSKIFKNASLENFVLLPWFSFSVTSLERILVPEFSFLQQWEHLRLSVVSILQICLDCKENVKVASSLFQKYVEVLQIHRHACVHIPCYTAITSGHG